MSGITKLMIFLYIDIPSINNRILSLPPLEKLSIFIEFSIIIEIDRILLYVLVCDIVAI